MSEAKFTPGPWVFTVSRNGVRQISSRVKSQICRLWNWKDTEANGHLIASAPELYEALDNLMGATGPGDSAQLLAEERDNIMELLAKARGEQ